MSSLRPAGNQQLREIDALIRQGHGAAVRARLAAVLVRRPPRDAAPRLAQLAWRAGLPEVGLRVLNPLVRPTDRKPTEATPLETAEYAACLIKAGAVDEGAALLSPLDAEALPRVWLYRAFACVARWDYADSIPLLEAYLNCRGLSSYDRLVGRVNLAAALVLERRHRAAEYLLRQLLHEASVRRLKLALGRVLELSAENFLLRRQWNRAESFLERARQALAGTEGVDLFIAEKTSAILDFLRKPGAKTLAGLRSARGKATVRRHWESVRDCDRAEALGGRDQKLLLRVCFGTPHDRFRHWIRIDYPGPATLRLAGVGT